MKPGHAHTLGLHLAGRLPLQDSGTCPADDQPDTLCWAVPLPLPASGSASGPASGAASGAASASAAAALPAPGVADGLPRPSSCAKSQSNSPPCFSWHRSRTAPHASAGTAVEQPS